MAHLNSDLRPCCKDCIYLGYYDDRQSSWFYCSRIGDAYCSTANLIVDHKKETVYEKREGDIQPRFYINYAPSTCIHLCNYEELVAAVKYFDIGKYRRPLLHILRNYPKY